VADLKGKIVLVTGANAGAAITSGIAEGLAEAGATLYLTGCNTSSQQRSEPSILEAIAASVARLGGQAVVQTLDQGDDVAVAALFERIATEQGRLDLLVNIACPLVDDQRSELPFWQQSLSVWDEQPGASLRSAYIAAVKAAELMVAAGCGLIVNVAADSVQTHPGNVISGVVTAAVERMARDMAQSLTPHQVSTLALRPGRVKTSAILAEIAAGTLPVDPTRTQSPRFIGRCIAALAMDPDIADKTGGSYAVATLATEYRFSDPDWHQEP
jgi:NAD(P)-dependent dehydrogenase (short-subunit alcohol dehydrogenase family)